MLYPRTQPPRTGREGSVRPQQGPNGKAIADIVTAAGHRVRTDCLPGTIHKGDDFVLNSVDAPEQKSYRSKYDGHNPKTG